MKLDVSEMVKAMKDMNASYMSVETEEAVVFIVTDKTGAEILSDAWENYLDREDDLK